MRKVELSAVTTISQYKKENHPQLSQICNYGICSKGPKKEFETAVVNEPSVFEPLKFYCTLFFKGTHLRTFFTLYLPALFSQKMPLKESP